MFNKLFKKNTNVNPCNTDKHLNECESVANLKQAQSELKELKQINLKSIIIKYFLKENVQKQNFYLNLYDRDIYMTTRLIESLFNEDKKIYDSFEERFKSFGKELDKYIDIENHKRELKDIIKFEKQNLGIE